MKPGRDARFYALSVSELRPLFSHIFNTSKQTDTIQAADSHKSIDDPGEKSKRAEKPGNQIKAEETDQSPVNSPDNDQSQRCVVKTFCFHSQNLLVYTA